MDDVLDRAQRAGVEGLTLLGGEPFDQAAPLAALTARAQAASLSIMTFTGYRLEDLRSWSTDRSDIDALLQSTDLLLDGPYLRDHPDPHRPWIGSTNQGIRHLSRRYVDVAPATDKLEVRIMENGTVATNGWASDEQLDLLLGGLGTRNDRISDQRTQGLPE